MVTGRVGGMCCDVSQHTKHVCIFVVSERKDTNIVTNI